MTALGWLLDGAIVLLMLGLAIRVLTTPDLLEAAILFVAYGLTLALAWVRLGAPDVALAEAALGAGVTGAIFLNAFQRLGRRVERDGHAAGSGTARTDASDRSDRAGHPAAGEDDR